MAARAKPRPIDRHSTQGAMVILLAVVITILIELLTD
jgi:hypothetical protein